MEEISCACMTLASAENRGKRVHSFQHQWHSIKGNQSVSVKLRTAILYAALMKAGSNLESTSDEL